MTDDDHYHFRIIENQIVVWDGHGGWTPVADIRTMYCAKKLIHYANRMEDVEEVVDRLIAGEVLESRT